MQTSPASLQGKEQDCQQQAKIHIHICTTNLKLKKERKRKRQREERDKGKNKGQLEGKKKEWKKLHKKEVESNLQTKGQSILFSSSIIYDCITYWIIPADKKWHFFHNFSSASPHKQMHTSVMQTAEPGNGHYRKNKTNKKHVHTEQKLVRKWKSFSQLTLRADGGVEEDNRVQGVVTEVASGASLARPLTCLILVSTTAAPHRCVTATGTWVAWRRKKLN